jgi:hypothetical protein
MINTRNKFLMASALALAVASCGGGGGKSNKSVYPTPPASLKQAVSIVVLDASTGTPIMAAVTVNAVGADAAKLKDSTDAGTPWNAAAGGGLVLTADSAITDATLVFSAPGYFNNSISVALKAGEMVNQTVSLSSTAGAAAAGITGAPVVTGTAGAAGLTAPLGTATPAATGVAGADAILAGAKVEASIPAGTKLLDKDGNEITGSVKMDMALFPNDANGEAEPGKSPLKSFPGGVNDVKPAGGSSGYFVSGGLTALELTGPGGEKVTDFAGGAVDVTTTVPQSTINPNTNAALADGDLLPIWSYDESTGEWTQEDADADPATGQDGTAATTGKTDGRVTCAVGATTCTVTMKATHLSYWNLDWFYSDRCDQNPVVVNVRDFNNNPIPDSWVKVEMRRVGGGWSKETSISGSSLEILNAPKGVEMDVIFFDAAGNEAARVNTKTPEADDGDDVCGLHNTTVKMDIVQPTFVKVVPKPQMVCYKEEDREKYKPVSVPAVLYVLDASSWSFITYEYRAANSTSALDLIKNRNYVIYAWTLEAVKDKDGHVVLPAYSWAMAGGEGEYHYYYTATADGSVPLNFYVPCSEVTGTGTGGGSDGQ